jgi:ribosomal protein S18 acetylase RimI-like enzyme
VIRFRSFRNQDPPQLADLWQSAGLGPLAIQPMTTALLDTAVFSKPYFDRHGLIVATDEADGGKIVGFAHAGFGPNRDRSALDRSIGSILLLVVPPHEQADAISAGLVEEARGYLKAKGAATVFAGGGPTLGGFYLGLYGGADLPGILDSSMAMQRSFQDQGFLEHDRVVVARRSLTGFRPPIDRIQVAIRRSTQLTAIDEPDRRNWWEAALTAGICLRRYDLRTRDSSLLATALFWDMQPMAASCGITAAGLLDLQVAPERRREGLASYLLAEAMHDLGSEGISVVEAHAPTSNVAATGLLTKLGYETSSHGTIYRESH